MEIIELFKNEQKYWKKKNQSLFGITPIDETKSFLELKEHLKNDCERFWNTSNPCKIAKLLNDGTLDDNYKEKVPYSYELRLNALNMCVDVLATYKKGDEELPLKICSLPTPEKNLCWIINNSHYTPRITATTDFSHIVAKSKKDNNVVLGELWKYYIDEDRFECVLKKNKFAETKEEIFNNHLSLRSKELLSAVLGSPLTLDNFTEGLEKLPIFEPNSIFNYKFSRFEYFEELVLNSRRKAKPLNNVLLGINLQFISQANNNSEHEGQLVLSQSPIFSLENFRTCINIFHSENGYTPKFTFADTTGFFDSFRTATSKSAGKQRLLLDNVMVKDDMLWVREEDGTEHSMFEYINKPQDKRISCLSYSPFCHNNKAKRLMMNAKMTSQAVPLKNEKDSITHRIPARVLFADIEGYTFADAIIISESFAKKLTTFDKDIIILNKKDSVYIDLWRNYSSDKNYKLTKEDLVRLYPTKNDAILDSYQNVKIKFFDDVSNKHARLMITWEIPFGLGDKISNLHGAKGVVGKILPDDQMPKLVNKVGVMEEGPLEVVISGFSTMRRGSLGQIFEAWLYGSGTKLTEEQQFISYVVENYKKELEDYASKSVVSFNGKEEIKPVGIIDMIRLYHHASTKVSESRTTSSYKKMLKLGEMEKLNLLAQGTTNILKELSIRSLQKNVGSHRLIYELETDRKLPKDTILTLRFAQLLKSFGYDIKLDGKSLVDSDTSVITLDEKDIESFNSFESDNNNSYDFNKKEG